MKSSFSISEALSWGFETFKKNWQFLVIFFILVILADFIPSWLHDLARRSFPDSSFIFSILSFVVDVITSIGIIVVTLKFVDRKKPEIEDLYQHYSYFLNYILSSIIYCLIIIAGLILFIIPGIYWAVKYQFYKFYIVDKNMGPWEAIKASGRLTRGNKWKLLWMDIVFALISLLGIIALGIGILVAMPIISLASAKVYRKLLDK
jgi:uncharacterized membrane protein